MHRVIAPRPSLEVLKVCAPSHVTTGLHGKILMYTVDSSLSGRWLKKWVSEGGYTRH